MMRSLLALLVLIPSAASGRNDTSRPAPGSFMQEFRWREIGPCTPGGRIVGLAVVDSKPSHYYVAAATGGVWKTVNNGTTWTPIFDAYGTSSIGDIVLCQSNPEIIWVGTGEANARNSVTHGDGVYKSTDGGKTFKNMGLRETRHIGRVAIHPKKPEVVYVATLGCVYAPTRDRGLFKTVDGGTTWRCVKFVDENTGFIDVAIDPANPETVLASAYEVRRDGFSGSNTPSKFGAGAGIYRSTDGGESWTKIAAGLPAAGMGRVGLQFYKRDSKIAYAVVETKQTPDITGPGTGGGGGGTPSGGAYMGVNGDDGEGGIKVTNVPEGGPAAQAGLEVNDIIKEFGGKKVETFAELANEVRTRKPGDKVEIKILRNGEEKVITVTLGKRPDEDMDEDEGDISFQDNTEKGGVFRSEDGGETWKQMSTTNERPFYYSQIRVDPNSDQQIWLLGTNLYVSTSGGRQFGRNGAPGIHVDHHAMWIDPNDSDHLLLGNDGGLHVTYDRGKTWEHLNNLPIGQFYSVGLDMSKPYRVYGGLQDNGSWGGPSRTRDGAIGNEHWSTFNGGDGFYCRVDPSDPNVVYSESQYGMPMRMDRKTGVRKAIRPRGNNLRFEWNTPIEISPIDPKRIYIGAQKLFESPDRGDTWKEISAELTKTSKGSITAIGLSPVDENLIWAGTNDGGVHVTRDRGKTWEALTIPGLPALLWVTRLEPSRTSPGTAWLTVEGRRKNDLRPYVWKTTDFGKTWAPMVKGLPADEPVYVIRQDPKNHELLFLGTERGVYASLGGGKMWVKLGQGLPVVPVHDLAIHPRDAELVAATHGRSVWIVDIKPLEETTLQVMLSPAHLFEPREVTLWNPGKSRWFGGAKDFRGQNPPSGTTISYYLGHEAKELSISIADKDGKSLGAIRTVKTAGLHQTPWNLQQRGRSAVGEYTVTMSVDGQKFAQKLSVVADPGE